MVIGLVMLMAAAAFGQNVSSSVKGVVTDPTGAVVAGANLTLTNQGTATAFNAKSDETGSFTFLNVLPGKYSLKIEAAGFTTKTLTDLVVEASQIRTIGSVRMEVGGSTTEVSVTAEAAAIQLASAEKAGTVTSDQLETLAIKGRDVFALLTTIPGVVDNGTAKRDFNRPTQLQGTMINGGRDSSKNFTVDGVTNMDVGSNQTVAFTPSPDSVQEIRILTSNYQAEYGRNAAGTINVITKGGTRDFHGNVYDYYRHESLNANSWGNNRTNTKKQPYRLRNTGFTVGGPIYIPGKLNTNRDKLFFFWSEEFGAVKQNFINFATTPTQLERAGDFSQSKDGNGKQIYIKDPLLAGACNATDQTACFPGNRIPTERLSAAGQNILNFFPLPNYTDPDPLLVNRRNYRTTYSGDYTRRSDMVRIDANPTSTLSMYFRFNNDADEQIAPWGNWLTSMNWMPSPVTYNQPGRGLAFHVTKVFSPTLINEFNFGYTHNRLSAVFQDNAPWQRSKIGIGEWFDDSDYVPNLAFGGQHSTPININLAGQFPYVNTTDLFSFTDNLSKTYKNHNFRAGIYVETTSKDAPVWNSYRGSINFGHSTLNPLTTGDGFANALLGVVTSYSESSKWVDGAYKFRNYEWYVQDNWKVTSRLTLDLGVRFYHMSPVTDDNGSMATFDPRYFDPAKAPRLYQPAMNGGARMGYDAQTNTWVPAVMIGFLVPGSGDPNNGGMAPGVNGYPQGNVTSSWLDVGPRFGFAYDVFGNGKTALRGGIGIFKDRGSILPSVYSAGGPPVAYSTTAYYTTLDQLPNAAGARGPSGGDWLPGGTAFYGEYKTPTISNFSLGVQQELPAKFVLDVSYVGSLSRHLWVNRYINPIPVGARFNPANVDSTTGGVLPDNFMRIYRGWNSVKAQEFTGTANYNSMQVALNRRFTNGLQFGASYTWSKALGVQSDENGIVSSYLNPRDINYGMLAQDRSHVLVINYYYDLPKLGKKYGIKPLGWITDNWAISGINTFSTGAPTTPYIYWTDSRDVTGSTDTATGQLIGNPYQNVPTGLQFNPAAYAPTPKGTYGNVNFGNVRPGTLRLPGINNWDFTLTKHVPLGSERRYIQFRAEMFNVFNHTQYSTYDTSLGFDATGKMVNANAGKFTGARDPRQMQLSLKLFF